MRPTTQLPIKRFWTQRLQIRTVLTGAFCVALACLFFPGCKDPYDIKVPASQKAVLIVEGFLASGGPTTIKLSRSFGLSDNSQIRLESGASVTIEGGNQQYPLLEQSSGTYSANLGVLNPAQKYRLHIKTAGKEYLSDSVAVQSTPPIDSVNWVRDSKGVTLFTTTHDPAAASHYYQFNYEETWETHSHYIARWKYNAATQSVVQLQPSQMTYQCWKTQPSSSLTLATSTALQSDVIYQKPLVFIPNADQKLSVRYSILVKQYVLSKAAYEFFQLMKKNTESLGTVFDAQPSQLTGNIHSVSDAGEPVVGFFYASSEQQKRIFIDASQVPDWNFQEPCDYKTVPPNIDSVKVAMNNGLYVYDADLAGIVILDYKVTDRICFDCTLKGGNTVKPVFW